MREARAASALDHPERLHDPRDRRDGRWPHVHRHGLLRGETLRDLQTREPLPPARAVSLAAAGRERAGGRARERQSAPRPEAREPLRLQRRRGEDPRLRARQAGRRVAHHGDGNGRRHPGLHGSRAARQRRGRGAERRLELRRRALRDARQPRAVPRRVARGAGLRDRQSPGSRPRELRPDLPPPLVDLVTRMLAKEPQDRPSAARVRQELRALQQVLDAEATLGWDLHGPTAPRPAAVRAKPFRRARRTVPAAVAIGGVLGLALVAALSWQLQRAHTARRSGSEVQAESPATLYARGMNRLGELEDPARRAMRSSCCEPPSSRRPIRRASMPGSRSAAARGNQQQRPQPPTNRRSARLAPPSASTPNRSTGRSRWRGRAPPGATPLRPSPACADWARCIRSPTPPRPRWQRSTSGPGISAEPSRPPCAKQSGSPRRTGTTGTR